MGTFDGHSTHSGQFFVLNSSSINVNSLDFLTRFTWLQLGEHLAFAWTPEGISHHNNNVANSVSRFYTPIKIPVTQMGMECIHILSQNITTWWRNSYSGESFSRCELHRKTRHCWESFKKQNKNWNLTQNNEKVRTYMTYSFLLLVCVLLIVSCQDCLSHGLVILWVSEHTFGPVVCHSVHWRDREPQGPRSPSHNIHPSFVESSTWKLGIYHRGEEGISDSHLPPRTKIVLCSFGFHGSQSLDLQAPSSCAVSSSANAQILKTNSYQTQIDVRVLLDQKQKKTSPVSYMCVHTQRWCPWCPKTQNLLIFPVNSYFLTLTLGVEGPCHWQWHQPEHCAEHFHTTLMPGLDADN